MILQIFVPGTPKNSNAQSQWARFASAKDRKKFRAIAKAIGEEVVSAHDWQAADFTRIVARQVSPVMRRRDPTGLAERLKGILDGLVDAKVIPDDDENHIEIQLKHSRKAPVAGIELTLFAAPPRDNP